jgi:hypothetical protein
MSGQLSWLPKLGSQGKLTLHLRMEPYHPWKPHTAYPGLCVPDYPIPGGSPGWATCQKLLAAGWTAIPTKDARRPFEEPISIFRNRSIDARSS